MSLAGAAAVLGDGVIETQVRARLRRGSLSGEQAPDRTWRVWV